MASWALPSLKPARTPRKLPQCRRAVDQSTAGRFGNSPCPAGHGVRTDPPPFIWLFRRTLESCLLGFSPVWGVEVIRLLSISRSIRLLLVGFSLSSLKQERGEKRNVLSSASFSMEQSRECHLLEKVHQGSLYCSTSRCRTCNKSDQLGFYRSWN